MDFQVKEQQIVGKLDYGSISISADSNIGFKPSELLVSSLVGCSGGVLRTILEKKRVSYQSITIDANVTRKEVNKISIIEKIDLTYSIFGRDLDEKSIKDSVKLVSKNCPINLSIKDCIKISESYRLIPS